MASYILSMNGQEIDQLLAPSPKGAIKLYGIANASGMGGSFHADEMTVISSRKSQRYTQVDYFPDDNSLYYDYIVEREGRRNYVHAYEIELA